MLLEGHSPSAVNALLGDRITGRRRSATSRLEVVTFHDRWAVLLDPDFEFGDAWDELQAWSCGTRVVCLMVIEPELFSHALVWADGSLAWQVSFEAELDDRPSADGRLPFDLAALAGDLGPADDQRTWFRLPIAAVTRLTGWHPARSGNEPPPS